MMLFLFTLGATYVSAPANHREREGDRGDQADKKKQEEPTQYISPTPGTEKETSGKQMYPPLYICPDQAPGKEQKKKRSLSSYQTKF